MSNLNQIMEAIMCSDTGEEVDTDPIVGQLAGGNAVSWKPSDQMLQAAASLGYGQGVSQLKPMMTPKGRLIGFPFPTPRPFQLEAVDAVLEEFKAGNNVLFEAGTGFGKSPLEIGVVSAFQSAYLLIGRNDLVDQWERDFDHFSKIGFYKARARFDCTEISGDRGPLNCSQAKTPCGKKRQSKDNDCQACPYAVNRDVALAKPYTVMTLSLGMTIFKHLQMHPGVTKRDVMVIDECSELESEIMKFFEFQVSTKTLFRAIQKTITMGQFFSEGDDFYSRWPNVTPSTNFAIAINQMRPISDTSACFRWAIEISGIAQQRMNWLGAGQKSEEAEKIAEACEQIIRMCKQVIDAIGDNVPYFGEMVPDEVDGTYKVRVSPLEAKGMLRRLLAPYAKHLLFVSATTGSAEMFARTHSLPKEAPVVKVTAPSGFPVANRMVYNLRAGNMSNKTQVADSPLVLKMLVDLATQRQSEQPRFDHINQKGIIHTYNNKITDMVLEAFRSAGLGHRVIPLKGSGKAREQAMEIFTKTTQPLILVSPSAMLGLSLNDDLARWQAIVKVPYPYLGDQSIAHRKETIAGWYEWQTAKDLIQTFGRIVRSDSDWGSTYILDDAFTGFYSRNSDLFPAFIREAIWQKP
jgi:Rad3-related DNA helicase